MTKSSHPSQKFRRQDWKNQVLRALRPWHRRLGLCSALFIMLLVVTGVAINHSQDFKLDTAQVKQAWLLDYYGISAPNSLSVFSVRPQVLVATDTQLWLEDKLILETKLPLLGAMKVGQSLFAIDSQHGYLFSLAGELYETQGLSTGLPQGIEAMTYNDEGVWLKTAQGLFLSDEELVEWQPASTTVSASADIAWLTPIEKTNLSKEQWQSIELNARSGHLTWERVTLDLHSGRLFGPLTVWLWDLFALALLMVVGTGCWIWWRQSPSRK
ncbi:PepSY domain-containing protein [Shewanella sp.]|uniref:PepSY domain-containing protein n=1 Tax=Shewanella sp. TaxID=50422 RepID=UPI0040548028